MFRVYANGFSVFGFPPRNFPSIDCNKGAGILPRNGTFTS